MTDVDLNEIFIVKEVCGDYAIITSTKTNQDVDISVFLLPPNLMVGDKLKPKNILEYERV